MTLTTNIFLQMLGTVVQGLNQASPMLSANGKFWVATATGALQLLVAVIAHFSNTDGTPQVLPYVKK